MKQLLSIIGLLLLVIVLGIFFVLPKAFLWFQIKDAESFAARLEKKSVSADGVMFDYPMMPASILSFSKSDVYMNKGTEYTIKHYYAAAIFCYNRALDVNPNNIAAYINRAKAFDSINKFDEAILDFNRVIEIDPYNIEAYGRRSFVYIEKGNLDKAIADCNKALKLNPQNPQETFGVNDRFETKRIDSYIKENQSRAYFYRGTAYEYKGDLRQALSDYDKAIDIGSFFVQYTYYYSRAKLYFQMQKYDKSWEDIHRAESLGYKADPYFLKNLKKASRRNN